MHLSLNRGAAARVKDNFSAVIIPGPISSPEEPENGPVDINHIVIFRPRVPLHTLSRK
jgi:hypothetical protein